MKWGRSSFKLGNWVAINQAGRAAAWVEHNQRLFNRDEVWLRVFKETEGWDPIAEDQGMFGSPPRDPGIWDFPWLKGYWDEETHRAHRVRPQDITPLNRRVTEWFFRTSAQTGCAFELGIIATLKGTDCIGNGHMDHIMRVELLMFDELRAKYPRAKIIANACNEWNAHSRREDPWGDRERIDLNMVNMWAVRRDRDGYGHGELVVDGGGDDSFDYAVNANRNTYDWGMIHPSRGGRWWEAPPTGPLVAACHGRPYGANESMYYVDPDDVPRAEQWYRNRGGWQHDVARQMELYANLEEAGFGYITVHDEKGAQCDVDWPRPMTRLEAALHEKFKSSADDGGGGGHDDDHDDDSQRK